MTDFKDRMASGQMIAGTFVKTPAIEMVEVLSMSGLDVLCLDAEHAPFDRARLDACLAVARGRGIPCLVRVPDAQPSTLLQVLDSGANGVVVPHVDSAKKAAAVSRACRFGHGGRGFAGSTRSANYATQPMSDVLEAGDAVTVIAQIEDPEGVTEATAIAGTEGIDGIFLGPADLSVAYGKTDTNSDTLLTAIASVGSAARAAGKAYWTYAPTVEKAAELQRFGFTGYLIASEQAWMLQGARATADGLHALTIDG